MINTWLMTTHVEWPNISEYDQSHSNQLWALRKRTWHFGFHLWIHLFAMQQPLPVLLHPSAISAVFRNEAALGLDRNGSWTITLGTSPSESYQWAEYQTPSPHIRQHEPGRSGAFPAVLGWSRLYLYSWWNLQGSSKCQSGSSEYLVQVGHFHMCCYMCSCEVNEQISPEMKLSFEDSQYQPSVPEAIWGRSDCRFSCLLITIQKSHLNERNGGYIHAILLIFCIIRYQTIVLHENYTSKSLTSTKIQFPNSPSALHLVSPPEIPPIWALPWQIASACGSPLRFPEVSVVKQR